MRVAGSDGATKRGNARAHDAKAPEADRAPLFIIESEGDGGGSKRTLLAVSAVAIVVCVGLYILGVMLSMQLLTMAALLLAVVSVIVIAAMRRKIRKSMRSIDEAEIDAQVERYKIDLIDTFNGYDVPYTADMILNAADDYRRGLIEELGGGDEVDPTNMMSVLRAMASDSRKARAERKALFGKGRAAKAEREQARARDMDARVKSAKGGVAKKALQPDANEGEHAS